MDTRRLLCCALAAVVVVVGVVPAARAEEDSAQDVVNKLKFYLLGKRDTLARPDVNATMVNVTLGVKHVSLVEMTSTMVVSAWIKMEWVDQRTAWGHEKEFDAVRLMHMPSRAVWLPDIVLKNGLAGKADSVVDVAPVTLYPDGRVTWTPAAMLEAYCDLDLRRWPFEQHACKLRLGSWNLDRSQLKYSSKHVKLEFPGQLGEFIVDGVDSEYDSMREDDKVFEHIDYLFRMHRAPGTYRAIIFTPAAVVIILCLSTFCLPPRAGEKILLGGVNAMLICLFLIFFAHALPVPTDQTPFVVVFYAASLYLVSFSLVASVLVLNVARQAHAAALPRPIKILLTGPFGRALLLQGYIEQLMGVDLGPCSGRGRLQEELPAVLHPDAADTDTVTLVHQMQRERPDGVAAAGAEDAANGAGEIASRKVRPAAEWLLLAAAIDRVLFVMYSLLFVVLAIAFHV